MTHRDYRRILVEPRDSWHCVVDAGGLNDATVAILMRYTVKAGDGHILNHDARTIEQPRVTRYDVVGVRRLSPQLSHVEQAERIAGWLATLETKSPVRVVLNTIEIGQPAAASFRVLRPRHFAMAKADAAEHLHSLLLAKLNNHSLRFADDLALRLGDLDCEHAGDARACAIGIWASTQGSSSEPLRL